MKIKFKVILIFIFLGLPFMSCEDFLVTNIDSPSYFDKTKEDAENKKLEEERLAEEERLREENLILEEKKLEEEKKRLEEEKLKLQEEKNKLNELITKEENLEKELQEEKERLEEEEQRLILEQQKLEEELRKFEEEKQAEAERREEMIPPSLDFNYEERTMSILIYMAADNNLESEAIADLCEMEMSRLNTNKITVLVLLDRNEGYNTSNGNWSCTKMFKLKTGKNDSDIKFISEEISCPELNLYPESEVELDMSSNYVLESSISFMKKRFPAEYYGLIMWGHGTGWRNDEVVNVTSDFSTHKAYCYDLNSNSYMSLFQLSQGLLNSTMDGKLDFIGFDTCFGGELENAYELKDYCNYMVGSEGLTLASGWNYEVLFNRINEIIDLTPLNLCNEIVYAFENEYKKKKSAVISVIDMFYVQSLFDSFEDYMKFLSDAIKNELIRDEIMHIISSEVISYTYGASGSDVYLDVNSLIKETYDYFINKISDVIELETKTEALYRSLDNAIVNSWSSLSDGSCLGVFFSELASGGLYSCTHPYNYIKNNSINQIKFVEDSYWYVPSKDVHGSFLDKLFYTLDF